jgi:hypothetical protein
MRLRAKWGEHWPLPDRNANASPTVGKPAVLQADARCQTLETHGAPRRYSEPRSSLNNGLSASVPISIILFMGNPGVRTVPQGLQVNSRRRNLRTEAPPILPDPARVESSGSSWRRVQPLAGLCGGDAGFPQVAPAAARIRLLRSRGRSEPRREPETTGNAADPIVSSAWFRRREERSARSGHGRISPSVDAPMLPS